MGRPRVLLTPESKDRAVLEEEGGKKSAKERLGLKVAEQEVVAHKEEEVEAEEGQRVGEMFIRWNSSVLKQTSIIAFHPEMRTHL